MGYGDEEEACPGNAYPCPDAASEGTPMSRTRPCQFTRRTFARLMAGAGLLGPTVPSRAAAQTAEPAFSYPMGLPDRPPGDGMLIRHGYATENTWYNPGWWHTGEDWYLADGESAGLAVSAVAAGEVVFAGSEYPGLVVIVAHPDGLYSMYGHLDYALAVAAGDVVERGQRLGTLLARTDGRAPSHLHFELRTFLTTPEVNGAAPRYGVGCGYECPPGPGYWPIDAPEHPSALGWRNPTHAINARAFPNGEPPAEAEVVVAAGGAGEVEWWSAPADEDGATPIGSLPLLAGERYPLLGVATGPEASEWTSAEAYRLWYRVAGSRGDEGWVRAAVPSAVETGGDGRPSAVGLALLPAVPPGS
jgi:murein DD-endopeptidase MepM/ murein hydrolase activator NlpD